MAELRTTSDEGAVWSELSPAAFDSMFYDQPARSSFRLERLQEYVSAVEAEPLARFRRGERDDLAWHESWIDMLRGAAADGRTVGRVHLVREPWTPYIEFELTRIYPPSVDAGEDIRILTVDRGLPDHDFWLLDGTACRMRYSDAGEWLGIDCTTDSAAGGGAIGVRDSKQHGGGPVLSFTAHEWDTFVAGVKAGEFDRQ